jgi:hypothetical protein
MSATQFTGGLEIRLSVSVLVRIADVTRISHHVAEVPKVGESALQAVHASARLQLNIVRA